MLHGMAVRINGWIESIGVNEVLILTMIVRPALPGDVFRSGCIKPPAFN